MKFLCIKPDGTYAEWWTESIVPIRIRQRLVSPATGAVNARRDVRGEGSRAMNVGAEGLARLALDS
jgi:hypothetical protein